MEIQWFSNNMPGVVSIYETNITLNTVAASYFQNSYSTRIGFDKSDNTLIIKSISKSEVEECCFTEADLHPISIKASYGRINGKTIVNNLCSVFPLDFTTKNMYKFFCYWDESKKFLKVHLDEEVK